ncbi:hypothetical protein ACHAXH_007596 [Discostella pseudostelligera]
MATSLDDNDEEQAPLNSTPLDERILEVVRNAKKDRQGGGTITVRPALLTSELGLSVEEATCELCGLLSAVGGGEDGASFKFERVEETPKNNDNDSAGTTGRDGVAAVGATTMVFTFPSDFEEQAKRYRRHSDFRHKLHILCIGFMKALKIFTAFGLIISLAVLIIIGICLLIAAVIALARSGGSGGGNGHGGGRNQLMHKLRYLFFQLRQILWLYAICGNAIDGTQDPFMREIAGDIAMTMSLFCGNPIHPFFWFRLGSMRSRWARLRNSRGWGNTEIDMMNGVTMLRRGSWGQNNDNDNSEFDRRINQISDQSQQRGLLSIAVEFLFGPSDTSGGNHSSPMSSKELDKWKFRAAVIMSLSSKSPGSGISLRHLLPFIDNPPASADDPSAIREVLRIVTYFNGKPADHNNVEQSTGIDAKFCFPEVVAELDSRMLLTLETSAFAPPSMLNNDNSTNISSILYKEDAEYYNFGSSVNATDDSPIYLYEQPFVLTELTRQQFGQCVVLGLLNSTGIIWAFNAMKPGGMLSISTADTSVTGNSQLVTIASRFALKLLHVLRFYALFFLVLPLCRLLIVLVRNYLVQRRNKLRSNFVT